MQEVRFAKSARRHRIGKARVLHVMEHSEATVSWNAEHANHVHVWIGVDDRGLELEVVAVEKPDCLLVIHAMPTDLRDRR